MLAKEEFKITDLFAGPFASRTSPDSDVIDSEIILAAPR